jgi:hypothetical protein
MVAESEQSDEKFEVMPNKAHCDYAPTYHAP